MMYVPMAQSTDPLTVMHARVPMLWFVRTRINPFSVSSALQRELTLATGVPVAKDFIRSMDQMVAESMGRQSFNMFLMALFGTAALLLAGDGIYGVTRFLVQQRTAEIGIRLALGATPAGVWHMVVVQSTRMAAAGVAIGIIAALAMARLIAAMLFGVTTHDPFAHPQRQVGSHYANDLSGLRASRATKWSRRG
jgi:ABC-type antimicrobial peptide transport system permease subunit